MRRPIRRAVRRTRRRTRRRLGRRRRRIVRGTTAILLVGATARAFKLNQGDIAQIEQDTGGAAEDLSEEELLAAMRKLGIDKLELDAGDQEAIDAAQDEKE